MPSGPPKHLETLARILIPRACREEVLGDLCERYRSPAQYLGDLISTVPCIFLSLIMRRTDLRLLPTRALIVFASFLTAAWYKDRVLLADERGLLHLVIPAGLTLLYLVIAEVFSEPGLRWTWRYLRKTTPINMALLGICYFAGLLTYTNISGFLPSVMLDSLLLRMFDVTRRQPRSAAEPAMLVNEPTQCGAISRAARFIRDAAFTALCVAAAAVILLLLAGAMRNLNNR